MPIVTIELLPGRSEETKGRIAEAITKVLTELAGGSREHCLVLFREVSADNWAIGGSLVSSPSFAKTLQSYKDRAASVK